MTKLVVCPIAQADNKVLKSIIQTVLIEWGYNRAGFAWEDPELDNLYQTYKADGHQYFKAVLNGEIVGGAGIAPLKGGPKDTGELQKMYLSTHARGHGVGKQLMQACLQYAQQQGYKKCYLETTAKMQQAQSLYKKFGFLELKAPKGQTGHHSCDAYFELDLTQKLFEPQSTQRPSPKSLA